MENKKINVKLYLTTFILFILLSFILILCGVKIYTTISINLYLFSIAFIVITEYKDKSKYIIVAMIIAYSIMSAGPLPLSSIINDKVSSESVSEENHSITEYYIGSKASFNILEKQEYIYLRFSIIRKGSIDLDISKTIDELTDPKDCDDWFVSIMNGSFTIVYEAIINRNETTKSISCVLNNGEYVLVFQRTAGNQLKQTISIDSTYHIV